MRLTERETVELIDEVHRLRLAATIAKKVLESCSSMVSVWEFEHGAEPDELYDQLKTALGAQEYCEHCGAAYEVPPAATVSPLDGRKLCDTCAGEEKSRVGQRGEALRADMKSWRVQTNIRKDLSEMHTELDKMSDRISRVISCRATAPEGVPPLAEIKLVIEELKVRLHIQLSP